ncbi:MAG: hypothetical protein GXO13_02040, partial [Epsilonproteobacteria bacterium]|nr:hypothetical protein [Campylobacterota bacterium]
MERNRANFTQANQIDEKGKNLEKNSTSPSTSPMANPPFPSSSPNKSRKKENFAQTSSTSDTSPISSTSDTSPTSSTSSNLPPSSISSPNSPLKLELTPTSDGSFTARHPIYDQCYHSREGAITESYYKHFLPAFQWWKFKNGDNHPSHLKILDICFGLGYNIWVTLLHRPPQTRLHIVSPELDREVVEQIREFPYPPQLEPIKPIILEISKNLGYKDKFVEIEVKIGDAREIVQKVPSHFFDVCYQDPFSPKVNPELWTIEFFQTL